MSAASATQRTFIVSATGVSYIDLAGLLSAQNKRLYRQGMVYHARISVTNGTPGTGLANNVKVLHNSWRTRKAWGLAKQSWWESTAEERAAGIKPGRWNDFKVFYEAGHNAGNSVGPTTAADGEWNYTNSVDVSTGALREFHMLGSGSVARFGVLREYDEMADQVQDVPAAAAAFMPYSQLIADRSNGQADQLQEEGDLPPYSAVDLERNTPETLYYMTSPLTPGAPVSTTGMIEIPCGLIKVDVQDVNSVFRIDFAAGSYKGVKAEVMA